MNYADLPLGEAYAALRARAEHIAGSPDEISRRAMLHYNLYLDSHRTYPFPIMAMHGALWGERFFGATGRLAQIVQHRYFYDADERAYRKELLNTFAASFKALNRAVFMDTYTNYHFTRLHGEASGAADFLQADLLGALNLVHRARAARTPLASDERRHVFEQALRWEQEVTVGPGVQAAIARFDCPILRRLCLSPVVRFTYFPALRYFLFRNFGDVQERLRRGMHAFHIADAAGWDRVATATRDYGVLPDAFYVDPARHAAELHDRLLAA